jgi:hypothetical protein
MLQRLYSVAPIAVYGHYSILRAVSRVQRERNEKSNKINTLAGSCGCAVPHSHKPRIPRRKQ